MTNTKEELVSQIKEWIDLDKEIKLLNKEVKERRNKKKILNEVLVATMKNNDIDCFDINGGKLLCSTNKIKQTINKEFLLQSLSKYFNSSDSEDIPNMVQYILDSRKISIKNNIRLKQPK